MFRSIPARTLALVLSCCQYAFSIGSQARSCSAVCTVLVSLNPEPYTHKRKGLGFRFYGEGPSEEEQWTHQSLPDLVLYVMYDNGLEIMMVFRV